MVSVFKYCVFRLSNQNNTSCTICIHFCYLCRGDVGDTRKGDDNTFLTQANVEDDGSFEKLPQIQQTSLQSEAQPVS